MVHFVTGSMNVPEKYSVAPGPRLCGGQTNRPC